MIGLVPRRFVEACVLMTALAGCGPAVKQDLPPFVVPLIEQKKAAPPANPPSSIWRFKYRGRTVFYVPPSCCDVPSELYDSDGNLVCSPDGGLTGAGDGRCPDFFQQRSEEMQIWSDARGESPQ